MLRHRIPVRRVGNVDQQWLQIGCGAFAVGATGIQRRLQQVVLPRRQRPRGLVQVADEPVIVQVLAHTGQIHQRVHTDCLQMRARTYSGQQQSLW